MTQNRLLYLSVQLLAEELTSEEANELEVWAKESDKNKNFLEFIRDGQKLGRAVENYKNSPLPLENPIGTQKATRKKPRSKK
jgi:hypothetical protein